MTPAETSILVFFRRYGARPTQMLFFNPNDCKMSPCAFPQCHGIADAARLRRKGTAQAGLLTHPRWVRAIALDCSAAAGGAEHVRPKKPENRW